MRMAEQLMKRMNAFGREPAVIFDDRVFTFHDLVERIDGWIQFAKENRIDSGTVTAIKGDYSPSAICLIIALILRQNIIVPLTPLSAKHEKSYFKISHAQVILDLSVGDAQIIRIDDARPTGNALLNTLITEKRSGLILFTSGSTGTPKAVAHDFDRLLTKFQNADKKFRTLCFLLFDHIAGIDTYFYSLFSGGTVVFPTSRAPEDICRLIEKHRVEILPTSPTFLNLLLLSGEYEKHDLSSLKIITFGSEPMSRSLLDRLKTVFPDVKFLQKYGVTELGSPASKSRQQDAGWIKIDSDRFQIRIVDGILHVKAETAMAGYLNAPSPFTPDGWFITGDAVETDGEYIRILGRDSEVINVGGEKVWPAEVEEVILQMPEVEDVMVTGIENPITGRMVQAAVKLHTDDSRSDFRKKMRRFCQDRLLPFQIPQKVVLTDSSFHGGRFKKIRRQPPAGTKNGQA